MEALLITVVILLFTMQSFLCKEYTDNYPGKATNASLVFTIVSGFIIAIVAFAFSGFRFDFNPKTLLLGLINAVVLYTYNYAIVKCSQKGPYSVLTVFSLGGCIILPAGIAHFAFGDPISVGKVCAIGLIIVAMYLMSIKNEKTNQKITLVFLLSCLLLFTANGLYGSLLDIQQRLTGSDQKEEMVATTFAFAALLSLILLVIREKKETGIAFKQTKKSLIFLLICGIVAGLAANTMTYVLTMVNITTLCTFDNSGVLLLSVILSRIFFKEKLSKVNILGCGIMVAGLVCFALL